MERIDIQAMNKRLQSKGLMDKIWKFACLVDNMITYEYSSDVQYHQITFWVEGREFLPEEKLADLMIPSKIYACSYKCFNTIATSEGISYNQTEGMEFNINWFEKNN